MLRPLFKVAFAFSQNDSKTRLCTVIDGTLYVLSSYPEGSAVYSGIPSERIKLNVPPKNKGTSSFLYELKNPDAVVDPSYICGYIQI